MKTNTEKDSPTAPAWARGVDWEDQDVRIAERVGRSRERVRQVRLTLGLPASPYHRMLKKTRSRPLNAVRAKLIEQRKRTFRNQ